MPANFSSVNLEPFRHPATPSGAGINITRRSPSGDMDNLGGQSAAHVHAFGLPIRGVHDCYSRPT